MKALAAIAVLLLCVPVVAAEPSLLDGERVQLKSPDGQTTFELCGMPDQLTYRVRSSGREVIERSRLSMIVDEIDLSRGVQVEDVAPYEIDNRFPWRGVHSEAVDRCRGMRISLLHVASGTQYTLDVRAYDDGVTFRHLVPGSGKQVPDEAHEFVIPQRSAAWHHGFRGHYEGVHKRSDLAELPEGEWCALPLTITIVDASLYVSISEGALVGYSGLGLQATGKQTFTARLAHDHPASYPFELRFGKAEAKRLAKPAAINGDIITPWRVVMIGNSLDALVNCDIIHNVSPPPDRELFPNGVTTAWLKPGRAVWKYLDGGESSLEGMQEFSRLAGELGFEYNLIEGFWREWPASDLRELIDYSRERGVGILVWYHSGRLRTREARREFFTRCSEAGVAGVKIDFLDHEAKEVVDLYQTLLREAAEHRLIVDFHGANKPAGESRTWPNEMTREAIFGLEMRRVDSRAVHDATLPFTRYLAGHADYTAVHFGDRRGDTSWAHQVASAAVFTSPLLVYGAHPQRLLENPAVGMIKSVPSVWDETIALAPSEIGELAVFARRRGKIWFLAVLNGQSPRSIDAPLSFLNEGSYSASLVRDGKAGPTSLDVETAKATAADTMRIEMEAGGGFIGRFEPQ
jgi:alpha-glucosidase